MCLCSSLKPFKKQTINQTHDHVYPALSIKTTIFLELEYLFQEHRDPINNMD